MIGAHDPWPWPFLRVAHRGAPTRAPGNSVRGFALAAALGADMVETDVRLSADGALVLSHDDAVSLAGPGRRPVSIARSTLAALRAPAAGGEPLATLDEALALRRHGAPLAFNLDLKVAGVGPPLARALRAAGRRDGILLTGYAAGAFARVREAEPWVRAALTRSARAVPLPTRALARAAPASGGRFLASRLVGEARAAGVGALALSHTLATPEVVRACHHAGVRVLVWTVDDPVRMRALRAAGVDGVTTNRVDLLCALDPAL